MMVGQGLYALCQWGKLVGLARLGGPEIVGTFALALAIAAPIMLFGGLQMRQVLVADAVGRFTFESYRTVRLYGISLAWLTVAAVAMCFGYTGPVAAVILSVGAGRAFESMSDLYYGLEQRHQRLDLVAQSMMLRGVLTLAALILVFWWTRDLALGALAMAVMSGAVWLLFDRRVAKPWRKAKRDSKRLARAQLWALAGLGLPLGVTLLLSSLNVNLPRYLIESQLGKEELGRFAAMAYFVTAGHLVVSALCQPASPLFANAFAKGDFRGLRKLLLQVIGACALLGLVGALVALLIGDQILAALYGEAFARGAHVFVWIMVTGLIVYVATPFGYALTAMQLFGLQPLLFGGVLAVNGVASYFLIQNYGMGGAVGGWLLASLCQALLTSTVCWWLIRVGEAASLPQGG
jgi:O-antigen/teichoic acid export membrane protein